MPCWESSLANDKPTDPVLPVKRIILRLLELHECDGSAGILNCRSG
jgi:hypothetical protein